MRYLSSHDLDRLAAIDDAECLTLLMPSRRAGAEQSENRTRLKSLTDRAEEQLRERGRSAREAADRLAPIRALVDDEDFWRERGDGLAIFQAGDGLWTYHLDHDLPERVTVADHVDIRPVLEPAVEDAGFALLACSPKSVRLFAGDRSGLRELDVPDMPESMEAYEAILDEEDSVQHHAHGAPMHGTPHSEGPAQYHGHGGGGDDRVRKLRLHEFSRQVDRAVRAHLNETRLPLLVVATDTMWPIYHHESEYPHLLPDAVAGNPDEWDAAELHRRAWPTVGAKLRSQRDEDRARFAEAQGRNGSAQLQEVVPAAGEGRIDTLLVAIDDQVWGVFDRDRRRVETATEAGAGRDELLALATCLTRRNGGRVRALPRADMPERAQAAAIFRY